MRTTQQNIWCTGNGVHSPLSGLLGNNQGNGEFTDGGAEILYQVDLFQTIVIMGGYRNIVAQGQVSNLFDHVQGHDLFALVFGNDVVDLGIGQIFIPFHCMAVHFQIAVLALTWCVIHE